MSLKVLKIYNTYTDHIRLLLENNPIGTPGVSMVYQHRRVEEKLQHIVKPFYVNLERNGNLIGTCCFCERPEDGYINYYIRYFAFQQSNRVQRNKGVSKLRSGTISIDVQKILEGTEFHNPKNKPTVFYAYLDPSNERSKVICESFGFQQVRKFQSILISRFSPEKRLEITKVAGEEKNEVLGELIEFYRDYNFFNLENIFFEDSYYVYKVNGEIVAGIQATHEKWFIHELPGLSGSLMLRVLSKLPYLNRLIKKDFSFLALEALFFKETHEDKIEPMIESIMHLTKHHVAMTIADQESDLFRFYSSINKGFISKVNHPKTNSVIAKINGKLNLNNRKNRPSYISTLDLT
jgi:hypothetical protein